MNRTITLTALVAVSALVTCGAALADGMLFPVERPHTFEIVPGELFNVRYHHVNVAIDDQVCTTKVDQIFENDAGVDREGIYIFPMPEGAAITKFAMYAGEEEISGKIVDKDEARRIYESIVRRRRDPAVLEYIDRNTFRARVYPVPAHGEKRIRLNYCEIARKTGNTCSYVYPLSTERFSARPLQDCKVSIRITSKRPITNVYSPTHVLDIDRPGDHEAIVTWEAKDTKPDTDLVLYWTVSDDDIGIDMIAHRASGEKGFYMLLASPRVQIDRSKIQPKNVVFVLDRTGSMAGGKLDQAKDALRFCLDSLHPEDRFNVVTFNESPDTMFAEMRKPDAEAKRKAFTAIDDLDATGGTNINEALAKALDQFRGNGDSRNYIVFLTDGLPTVGVTDIGTILTNASRENRAEVRIFAFGVGYDVNAHFLDKLSLEARGDADYVRPRENIEAKVSSFFAKVSDPLLSDVKVAISGVDTSEAFPSTNIPDIFKGTQLIILGRYSGSGEVRIELSGTAGGSRKTFTARAKLSDREGGNEFIPQLWAARKIGYLLDEIRLHSNQELVDEVVRLSREYGIPTEFTSFLADDRRLASNFLDSSVAAGNRLTKASGIQTDQWAVAQSSNARNLRNQWQLPQAEAAYRYYDGRAGDATGQVGKQASNLRFGGVYYDAADRPTVIANVQNVAGRAFYQRGAFWEDNALKENQQFVQVKQFSDAHFALLRAYPKLSQYSTLGNVRLTLENGQAVEIGPQGKEKMTDQELDSLLKGIPKSLRVSKAAGGRAWPAIVAFAGAIGACIPCSRRLRRR